jgi:uncharacterized protein YbgA (DUF1722 family)
VRLTKGQKQAGDAMTEAERIIVVRSAVRWTTNILVEVMGNHSKYLNEEQRSAIKRAIEALGDFK